MIYIPDISLSVCIYICTEREREVRRGATMLKQLLPRFWLGRIFHRADPRPLFFEFEWSWVCQLIMQEWMI